MRQQSVGNGERFTFSGALQVTGSCAIPTDFCDFNKIEFPTLIFSNLGRDAFDFDEDTGEITFKIDGVGSVKGTLNIDTTAGVSEVQVSTKYYDGDSWTYKNSRKAELPVIGAHQTVSVGILPTLKKGHKLKFEVKATTGNASFVSEILSNGSLVPAVLLQISATRN